MSLNISFYSKNSIDAKCPNCGKSHSVETGEEHNSHWQNITHNLGGMAREAGIYKTVWRPDENGVERPEQMIMPIENAIADMEKRPDHYKQFDADNGWGTYVDFMPWLKTLLQACKDYPNDTISVSR